MSTISRRRALGAAAAGLGAPVLAACGDDGSGSTATDPSSASPSATSTPGASTTTATGSGTTSAPPSGGIAVADVPVGGGLVVGDQEVVVTQPEEGDFRAFSALCTHQRCLVGRVADGEIQCPCHGSRFSITDGTPLSGPAGTPLAAVEVTVRGDRVVVG